MTTTRWPAPSRLPPVPGRVLSAGLCTRSRSPELWTSSLPGEREKAVAICGWCPALTACRAWSLTLPPNNTIIAALDSKGRQQLRKAAQQPSDPAAA